MMQKPLLVSTNARFSFRHGSFFPPQVFYAGVLGIAGAFFLFFKGHNDFSILILLIGSLLLIFASKGTLIHLQKQHIKKYVNFGGIVFGKEIHFRGLNELIIVKKRMSQTMYTRVNSSTIRYNCYQAFLVTDQEKFLLTEGKRKEKVMDKIKAFSKAAALPVKDLT